MESLRPRHTGGPRLKSSPVSLVLQLALLDSSPMSESVKGRSLIYGSSDLFHSVVPRLLHYAHSRLWVASQSSTHCTCKTSYISRFFSLVSLFYPWLSP